jgi:hypothetical protein
MTSSADFRTDPSDTIEGRGIARARWDRFMDRDLYDIMDSEEWEDVEEYTPLEELPEDVREELAEWARERSELLGFWVAWHLAGGFERLEDGGWHRATIFRKVHRFREVLGEHPDSYKCPWIKLDLRRAWTDKVLRSLIRPGDDERYG